MSIETFNDVIGFANDEEQRRELRKPFPKEQIGKLPATSKRPALDFVGHAAVTDRLNTYAPGWTYTIDQTFQVGESFWLRGTMTIGGVSRPEYGDGADPKEAIGNFIRRGAMRFGVALDLWSREELSGSLSRETPAGPLGFPPGTAGDTSAAPGTAADRGAELIPRSSPPNQSPSVKGKGAGDRGARGSQASGDEKTSEEHGPRASCKHLNGIDVDGRCTDCGEQMAVR